MLGKYLLFLGLVVFANASEDDAQDSDGESFCDEYCPDYFRKCPDVTSDHCGDNWFSIRCPRACGTCTPCDWAQQHDLEAFGTSLNDFMDETEEQFEEMLQKLEDTMDDVLDNNEALSNLVEEMEELNQKFQCSSDDDCNGHGSCSESTCSCDAGFEGDFCSNDLDECAAGDKCTGSGQTCDNTMGSYECECEDGYYMSSDGECLESALLNSDASRTLAEFLPDGMSLGERCFSLEEEGYGYYPDYFHYYCDNKGPTVTIVKAADSGWIFGGYTDISWSSYNGYQYNAWNSFLFTLSPIQEKLMTTDGNSWEIYDWYTYGPTFGGGHNLYCGSSGSVWGYAYSWSWSYSTPADSTYSLNGVSTSSSSIGSYTIESLEVYLVS